MPIPVRKTPRTRASGTMESPINDLRETSVHPTSGTSHPFTGQLRNCNWQYRVMLDSVVERFKEHQANGTIIMNGMDSYEGSSNGGSVGGQVRVIQAGPNFGQTYTCDGDWMQYLLRGTGARKRFSPLMQPLPILEGISELEINRAISESSTKAQTLPSDSQLLVALAEAKQTISLLPSIITSMTHLLQTINAKYSKLNWRAVALKLKDEYDLLNDLWLASRFGVRPLIADTMGMAKALTRLRNDQLARVTSRGSSCVNVSGQSSGLLSYGITRTPVDEFTSDSFSCRAMSIFAARLGLLDDLGVNLANVPLAVVDLTKFSFVLNWMVNVNDFALAMGTALQPGWDSLGACYVTRRETSTLYRTAGPTYLLPGYSGTYQITRSVAGSLTVIERSVRRVPFIPKPTLTVRADPLKWTRDLRLLDAVALSRQAMRGKGVQKLLQFGI